MDGWKKENVIYNLSFSKNLISMKDYKFFKNYPLNTINEYIEIYKTWYLISWKVPENLLNF